MQESQISLSVAKTNCTILAVYVVESRTILSHGRPGSVACSSPKADISSPLAEVYKARPKLQGEILKVAGNVHVCQLWSAAIRLLSLARIVTLPQSAKTPNSSLPGRRV